MMALLPFVIKYDKDLSLSNLADKEEVAEAA
jgi:hypothetical protein